MAGCDSMLAENVFGVEIFQFLRRHPRHPLVRSSGKILHRKETQSPSIFGMHHLELTLGTGLPPFFFNLIVLTVSISKAKELRK